MNKLSIKTFATGILIGCVISLCTFYFILPSALVNHSAPVKTELALNEPLYWVAPMDPNFRRDKPGKSPMGMDLVPVFANENVQDAPGTVLIDPVAVQNLGVKTALVNKILPTSTIESYGEVTFAEDNILHIHPRVEGWVETLSARSVGEFIKQGDALYSLYSPALVNAQEELLIALEQGNKALITAAQSRLISLNAPQSLIKTIRDTQKIMRTITYYAPQSGYVSELNIQEGFYVKPSTTMLAIAALDTVWILADVFASDANKVTVGQNAIIQHENLNKGSTASTIDYIYPTFDSDTRTLKVRFKVKNSDLSLKPGMYLKVKIEAFSSTNSSLEKVVAVPKKAVIRTGESDRIVLALGEGKYKSINIKLGRVFDNEFEVLSGVKEGDKIVTSAQFLLDSESSISSDFMRMETPKDDAVSQHNQDTKISAWTHATVNEVMTEERMINLTHGPLLEFNMMGMTMNFILADNLDMNEFAAGQQVHVEIAKTANGMYKVKTVHFMDEMENMNEGVEQP